MKRLPLSQLQLAQDLLESQSFSIDQPLTVERAGDNHIYFWSDVDSDRCLALIKELREVDKNLRAEHISRGLEGRHPPSPIWLHIHSHGGDFFAAMALARQIQAIQSPIWSIVEGYCASAATFISMACTRRFILPSSFMLIHQVSKVGWGAWTYSESQDDLHLLDMLMDEMIVFYSQYSKMNTVEVKELLSRNSFFSAEECVEKGLVDEIIVEVRK